MSAAEQHGDAVQELMRTRFPIHGDNYKKTPIQYFPRWGKPRDGRDAPYGHARPTHTSASQCGVSLPAYAQLYVYNPKEPDRPITVNVESEEAAEDMIRVLSEFLTYKRSEA